MVFLIQLFSRESGDSRTQTLSQDNSTKPKISDPEASIPIEFLKRLVQFLGQIRSVNMAVLAPGDRADDLPGRLQFLTHLDDLEADFGVSGL